MRKFFGFLATCLALSPLAMASDSDFSIASSSVQKIVADTDDSVELVSCNEACSDSCNANYTGLSCGVKNRCRSGCCGNWFDNTVAFSGVEAFKSIGDSVSLSSGGQSFGLANSAGLVNGLNTGFRLGRQSRIRGQVGGSIGVYDLKGRVGNNQTQSEQQEFLSAGAYKRSDVSNGDRIAWGVVYDQMWAHQWGVGANDFNLGQIRGIFGYALNEQNEVGFWGTAHTNSLNLSVDDTTLGIIDVQAVNQYNSYWRHNYGFGGTSMLYAGFVDKADNLGSWTLGSQVTAPMGQRVALYGNSAFMFPSSATGIAGSSELLWSVSGGLSYSFGSKTVSRNVSGQSCLPLLPVANNGTFLVSGTPVDAG